MIKQPKSTQLQLIISELDVKIPGFAKVHIHRQRNLEGIAFIVALDNPNDKVYSDNFGQIELPSGFLKYVRKHDVKYIRNSKKYKYVVEMLDECSALLKLPGLLESLKKLQPVTIKELYVLEIMEL